MKEDNCAKPTKTALLAHARSVQINKYEILKPWNLEIIGIMFAIASFGGLFGVLHHYDDKPPPRNRHVTLNAVVAVLAAIMSGALGMVIGSCVAQLKWNRYSHQVHRLKDFSTIDEASRGPLGGLEALRPTTYKVIFLVPCPAPRSF